MEVVGRSQPDRQGGGWETWIWERYIDRRPRFCRCSSVNLSVTHTNKCTSSVVQFQLLAVPFLLRSNVCGILWVYIFYVNLNVFLKKFFNFNLYVFRAILGSQKMRRCRDFWHTHSHVYSFLIIRSPTRAVHLSQLMDPHWHLMITQSPWFTLGLTLGEVHPVCLGKCARTSVDHRMSCRVSSLSRGPLCSARLPPPPPPSRATTDLFIAFPECRVAGITQHTAFADWFLSLSSRLTASILFTSWELFLFSCWVILRCLDAPQLVHSPAEGHLGPFQVLAITNKAGVRSACRILCGHKFPALLGKCQGVRSLDHMVGMCLLLWDPQAVFQSGCSIRHSPEQGWAFLRLHVLTSSWCCQCSGFGVF